MRLWSLHPKYLDAKGLVALWREGLLAQKVLAGETKGYRYHPQLERFQCLKRPLDAIGAYLVEVHKEACLRGYEFQKSKIRVQPRGSRKILAVADGQLQFEWTHLMRKLRTRDRERWNKFRSTETPTLHPRFSARKGGIAAWERAPV